MNPLQGILAGKKTHVFSWVPTVLIALAYLLGVPVEAIVQGDATIEGEAPGLTMLIAAVWGSATVSFMRAGTQKAENAASAAAAIADANNNGNA